jgi:hypothetical protein
VGANILYGGSLLIGFLIATYIVKTVARFLLRSLWNVYQIILSNLAAWLVISLPLFVASGSSVMFFFCTYIQFCWLMFDLIVRPKSPEEARSDSWYVYQLGVFAGVDPD